MQITNVLSFVLFCFIILSCKALDETNNELNDESNREWIDIPVEVTAFYGSKIVTIRLTQDDDFTEKISAFCIEYRFSYESCRDLRKQAEIHILTNTKNIAVESKLNSTVKFQKLFQTVYDSCYWELMKPKDWYENETEMPQIKSGCSGPGSTLDVTSHLRNYLLSLFIRYNITTFLDAPCGGMAWVPKLLETIESQPEIFPQFHYTGIDVAPNVIAKSKIEFQSKSNWSFYNIDMTSWISWETHMSLRRRQIYELDVETGAEIIKHPFKYDLIMAKDVFIHLTYDYIKCSINNFKRTNSTWLLATSHNLQQQKSESIEGGEMNVNRDVGEGEMFGNTIEFRPIDLTLHPFYFPSPIEGKLSY